MEHWLNYSSHGRKIRHDQLTVVDIGANWFCQRVNASGSTPLLKSGHSTISFGLITALFEMWHQETNIFHFLVGEITVVLDDVVCLVHIPIRGRLMHYDGCSYELGIKPMQYELGLTKKEVEDETNTQWVGILVFQTWRSCMIDSFIGAISWRNRLMERRQRRFCFHKMVV